MPHERQSALPLTPEKRELDKKKSELATLEEELAERELDLATQQGALSAFEVRYFRVVGTLYSTLDELEAQIAEALARRSAEDQKLQEEAASARAKAAETAGTIDVVRDRGQDERFSPSDDLRTLYREAARTLHPDLTTDDKERLRRTRAMAEANRAYAAGDAAKLRSILEDWHSSPDSIEGEGVGAELVRTIRKIHQVERRLADIVVKLAELTSTELYELKQKAEAARVGGRDLLEQMAEQLREQINQVRARLHKLDSGARA
jgi:hypothetical protein